jgi:hypothetical protein
MQMIIQSGLVFLCDHLDKNLFAVCRNKIAFAGAAGHIAFSFCLDVIRGLRCLSFPKKNEVGLQQPAVRSPRLSFFFFSVQKRLKHCGNSR